MVPELQDGYQSPESVAAPHEYNATVKAIAVRRASTSSESKTIRQNETIMVGDLTDIFKYFKLDNIDYSVIMNL